MKHLFLTLLVMVLVLLPCLSQNKNETLASERNIINEPMKLEAFKTIELIKPDIIGGKTLMEAMHLRKSDREFEQKNLSLRHLSDILWVANGVNRENGKRTVPSARALYPIKAYAVLENGIYYYNPEKHQLEPVVQGDFRELTGLQDFVYTAPLNVLFIADYNTYDGERPIPQDKRLYLASLDAAHCNQNIYLYCASEGLKTVERAGAKAEELLKVLQLNDNHQFIVAQTVGY